MAIQEHPPEDYRLFREYDKQTVAGRDLLIQDTDDPRLKNLMVTFYRIRGKNL